MSSEPSERVEPSDQPGYPLTRLLVPVTLLVLAAAGIALVRSSTETISPANRNVFTLVIFGLMMLAMTVWWSIYGPFTRRTRRICGFTTLGVIIALFLAFRLEGVSGDLIPRLVPRWRPRADELLAERGQALPEGVRIDLTERPTDFPQYLGRNRDGRLAGVKLARDWSAAPRELWRQKIGAGWSSFAIVGDYAVTQEQVGKQELVVCYELKTGKIQWMHSDAVRFSEKLGGDGPRATPTIHQGRVYAIGAMGVLNCIDGATGKPIWSRDVVAENSGRIPMYGIAGSPLLVDNLVVVHAGGANNNSLVAYDQLTGKPAWGGGSDALAYVSPIVMTIGGVRQIVVINTGSICGHDPADGHVLWSHAWPEGQGDPKASQPILLPGDRMFVSMAYGVGAMLLEITKSDSGDWATRRVWKAPVMRTKFATPILHNGFIYALDEGFLQCIDPATGKLQWRKSRAQRYGHGQILLVEDLLLVQAEEPGDLALVEPDPGQHRELARVPVLEGKSWNHPALAGKYLLMRNAEEAVCLELPVK